jgi:acyl dehydratase
MLKTINKTEVGQTIGYQAEPSPWHKVTQDQINAFADCTLDQQFIHTDPEKAKETPFGSTIAHGFLTLSMLSHFAEDFGMVIDGAYMFINSGFDKIRFIAPVKVGSQVRALAKVADIVETKPGQFRVKTEVTIEIEGGEKPALVAEWITVQLVA